MQQGEFVAIAEIYAHAWEIDCNDGNRFSTTHIEVIKTSATGVFSVVF